jgi:hypothetical protein
MGIRLQSAVIAEYTFTSLRSWEKDVTGPIRKKLIFSLNLPVVPIF